MTVILSRFGKQGKQINESHSKSPSHCHDVTGNIRPLQPRTNQSPKGHFLLAKSKPNDTLASISSLLDIRQYFSASRGNKLSEQS